MFRKYLQEILTEVETIKVLAKERKLKGKWYQDILIYKYYLEVE